MPKKGISNNPSGRPAGIPNKITKELRKKLKTVIDAELEVLPGLLQTLDPEKRLDVFCRLLKYCLPVVTPVKPDHGEPINHDPWADE